jgi:hypothetical protein
LNIVLPSDNSETLAVASANRAGNNYNHPSPATVKRLTEDFGLKPDNILVTEQLGTIVITFDDGGVRLAGRDGNDPDGRADPRPNGDILKYAIVFVAAAVVLIIVIWCVYHAKKRKSRS